ncbi:hypothetical protein EBU71_21630, partial [bacterium]|nr:hypothetical protein [Candidatus Elulimicrobium humile]
SFNGSVVNTTLRVEIDGKFNNDDINEKLRLEGKNPYEFDYLINVYSVTMNVFEIIGGIAGMKFT